MLRALIATTTMSAKRPRDEEQCKPLPPPAPCKQCVKIASLPATDRRAAGVLWEDPLWLVMHKRPPCGVVGHLQLLSKRHFQGPSTMNDDEAAAVGLALRRCEKTLEEVTGCDRVYTAALGSITSGGHFHAHMMPVHDSAPFEGAQKQSGTPFDVFLQEKLVADSRVPPADAEACARVAAAFAERMASPGDCGPNSYRTGDK